MRKAEVVSGVGRCVRVPLVRNFDSPSTLKGIRDDGFCRYGTFKNLLVVVAYGAPTASSARQYRAAIERQLEAYPAGVLIFTVVRPRPSPKSEIREIVVDLIRTRLASMHMVFVLESQGFIAASQRSVANLAVMASGVRQHLRISKDIDAGLEWLKQCAPDADGGLLFDEETLQGVRRFCTK